MVSIKGYGQAYPGARGWDPFSGQGSIALAITAIGLGLTALFQKQWAQHERLVYPLAEVSLELTEGFDQKPGWPAFMQSKAFWAGFFIAALPLLWNIAEYFIPDFPRIAIFDPMFGRTGRRGAPLSRYLPPFAFSYRILPTLMGFTFLCDLNILFSIWSVYLVGLGAQYAMNRVGFTVGMSGQEADAGVIVNLFSNGAMLGLALWAIWAARGHLKRVWRQVRSPVAGEASETMILSPRSTLLVLAGGLIYMAFWLYQSGNSPSTLILWMAAFWIGLFVSDEARSCHRFRLFIPLLGRRNNHTGRYVCGHAQYVHTHAGKHAYGESPFAGRLARANGATQYRTDNGEIDKDKPIDLDRRAPRRDHWRFLYGLAVLYLGRCQLSFLGTGGFGARTVQYHRLGAVGDTDRSVPDLEKTGVYLLGTLGALIFAVLQARLPWWPIHPMGLMVMYSWYMRIYILDIFLVWLAKLLVLQFGGILLYRRVRPCCYGLIVGFVFAIGIAFLVDVIWFPDQGHGIHGW